MKKIMMMVAVVSAMVSANAYAYQNATQLVHDVKNNMAWHRVDTKLVCGSKIAMVMVKDDVATISESSGDKNLDNEVLIAVKSSIKDFKGWIEFPVGFDSGYACENLQYSNMHTSIDN